MTEDEYHAFQSLAGNRTPSEWVRRVLVGELTRKPIEQAIIEEQWALRYVLINALPNVTQDLVSEADQKKADKARAILAEAR